jgi:membrane-associated phospholipid phosphatase
MNNLKIQTFLAIKLPVFFWLAVLIYLLIIKDYPTAIFITLGGIILRAVCELIYFFYKKPRPYQVKGTVPPNSLLFGSPLETRHASFPSAHAAVMFYAAFFLAFSNFYLLGIAAFIAAILTCIGRVKLLYHYTIDIFAGAALASIWLIFMAFVARI